MIEVVTVVIRAVRIAVHQEVIAKQRDLRSRWSLEVRSIRPEVHHSEKGCKRRPVAELMLIFDRARDALLVVVSLISVREQLVNICRQAVLVVPEYSRSNCRSNSRVLKNPYEAVPLISISGRISFDRRLIDPPKIGGPNRCCRSGAAVKIDTPDPGAREEHPGVMAERVHVLKRNAVLGHRIKAVRETAIVGVALAQTDPIRVDPKCTRSDIDDLRIIRHRRGKVLDETLWNFGPS